MPRCWWYVPFWLLLPLFVLLLLHSSLHGRLERCAAYLPQLQLLNRKVQKIMMKSEDKSTKEAYILTIFQYENFYYE